jgi:hypothetical protein
VCVACVWYPWCGRPDLNSGFVVCVRTIRGSRQVRLLFVGCPFLLAECWVTLGYFNAGDFERGSCSFFWLAKFKLDIVGVARAR